MAAQRGVASHLVGVAALNSESEPWPAVLRCHMTTRSTFGDQPLSRKKSSPAYGFGAASREVSQKVFVSQEHTQKQTAGVGSPGPAVYLLPASVGGTQPGD